MRLVELSVSLLKRQNQSKLHSLINIHFHTHTTSSLSLSLSHILFIHTKRSFLLLLIHLQWILTVSSLLSSAVSSASSLISLFLQFDYPDCLKIKPGNQSHPTPLVSISLSPFLNITVSRHGSGLGLNRDGSSVKFDPTRVTQLSWSPRYLFSYVSKWVCFGFTLSFFIIFFSCEL